MDNIDNEESYVEFGGIKDESDERQHQQTLRCLIKNLTQMTSIWGCLKA